MKHALLASDPQVLQQKFPNNNAIDLDGTESDFVRDDGPMTAAVAYFTKLIAKAKRMGYGFSRCAGTERAVIEDFERRKKGQNSIEQDDTIPLVVGIFKTNPIVLESYRRRYQYILIDEFQVLPKFIISRDRF